MTNFENIRNMTITQMAEFLCGGDHSCNGCSLKDKEGCKEETGKIRQWLEEEKKDRK